MAGLSAGGAMAVVMGATYPDLYAAIGVHSGLPYKSASDVVSAFEAMRGGVVAGAERGLGDRMRELTARVRAIVFHGEADQTVHPSNAKELVDQYRRDGDQTEFTRVPGLPGERSAGRTVIRDQTGTAVAELWMVANSGHAWSGGSADGTYTDPQGPDASREMMRFFLAVGRSGSKSAHWPISG